MNKFKGLNLVDRVPKELWTEVHTIVQEVVTKTTPKKKICKEAKWLSEEALQTTEKRRDANGKGQKESYIHLNAEFQRIARKDKRAFLSEWCKEMKENKKKKKKRKKERNEGWRKTMGKTRDLFRKILDNKGIFHARWAQ